MESNHKIKLCLIYFLNIGCTVFRKYRQGNFKLKASLCHIAKHSLKKEKDRERQPKRKRKKIKVASRAYEI